LKTCSGQFPRGNQTFRGVAFVTFGVGDRGPAAIGAERKAGEARAGPSTTVEQIAGM